MNITIRQLRAFCALARLNSFTLAAEALHTTQPALSAQISSLEEALGIRLFDRSTRSVSITTVGQEMLPAADHVISGVTQVISHAQDVVAGKVGQVAVSALPSIAANFFPEMILNFRRVHPNITVTLHDEMASSVVRRVREGAVAFGISNGPLAKDATLIFEPLGTDHMFAVMRPGNALASLQRLKLANLLETPLILMNANSSVRMIVDNALAALGHIATPAYETAIMSTAINLARAGLGVTILPGSSVGAPELNGLVVLKIHDTALSRSLGMVRHAQRSWSPAVEVFAAQTREAFISWLAHNHSPVRDRWVCSTGKSQGDWSYDASELSEEFPPD